MARFGLVAAALVAAALISVSPAWAGTCTSTQGGAWNVDTTWSCAEDADDIPDGDDATTISHQVTVPAAVTPTVASLVLQGTLLFTGGGPVAVSGNTTFFESSVLGVGDLILNGPAVKQTNVFTDIRDGARVTVNGGLTHTNGSLYVRSAGGNLPLLTINSTYTYSGGAISEGIGEAARVIRIGDSGTLVSTGTHAITPTIEIDGLVDVQSGTLSIVDSHASTQHSGDIQVAANATAALTNGTYHFVADTAPDVAEIRGAGTFRTTGTATHVTLGEGVALTTATVNLDDGSDLTLAGLGPIVSTTTVNQGGGYRLGPRGWNMGTLNITGGGHSGAGTDTVTTLNKSGGTYDLRDSASLIVNGIATHSAGGLWVRDVGGGDALLRINGTYYLDGGEIGEGANADGPMVEITGTGTLTSTVAGPHQVVPPTTSAGQIIVPGGQSFSFPLGLTQTGGSLTTVTGSITGTTVVAGGRLTGTGATGPVTNTGGTVAPGSSPGTLTINGPFAQSGSGVIEIEVAGTAPGAFDVLDVNGSVQLGGNLAVLRDPAFNPADSDTFQFLLSDQAPTGGFAALTGGALPGARSFAVQVTNSPIGALLLVAPPPVPDNTSPPQISGDATVGQTLTCDPGTWTGEPAFTYAWLRDGAAIPGAAASTYVLTAADAGHVITCRVTGTNSSGSDVATSAGVTPPGVVATPTPGPTSAPPASTPTPTPGATPTPPPTRREQTLAGGTLNQVATALGLPSARKCQSRRRFQLRVKRPAGVRLASVELRLARKKLRVRTVSGRFVATIDLRGFRKGRFTVTITAKTVSGLTLRGRRAYRTCTPRSSGGRSGSPL